MTPVFGLAQKVETKIHEGSVYFKESSDSILTYQLSPKSKNGELSRSNYIHPLYTIDGAILTEDFPKDHLHHRGIFWAWHQLYKGQVQLGDSWLLEDFNLELLAVRQTDQPDGAASIVVEFLWKTTVPDMDSQSEMPVVRETTEITVYPLEGVYRQIDLEISLLALTDSLSLGGSRDEKGYGGFSTRIRLSDDVVFTSDKGTLQPQNVPVKGGSWMDISGSLGKNGDLSGLSILCHPLNPEPTDRWILRAKGSMQNAVYPYPGADRVPLSSTLPTVLRYRLLVHRGGADQLDLSKIYRSYARNSSK